MPCLEGSDQHDYILWLVPWNILERTKLSNVPFVFSFQQGPAVVVVQSCCACSRWGRGGSLFPLMPSSHQRSAFQNQLCIPKGIKYS